MKNVLIVFGIVYLQVVFGIFTEDQLPPSHIECLKENNVPAETLLNSLHEDFTVIEDDPDVNKVILCAYRKANYLNADDTLDNAKLHDFLVNHFLNVAKINVDNPEEATLNAINACKTVQGTDAGDTLIKNFNCIVNYLRKL